MLNDETKALLETIHENLQQLFIVSEFEVAGTFEEAPEQAIKLEHAAIVVTKAEGETCERCWTCQHKLVKWKNIQHFANVVQK